MRRLTIVLLLLAGSAFGDELAQFERRADMNPDDAAAQFNWAVKAREAKKYPAALKAVKRVVALAPKDAVARELQGQLLFESGDEAGAVKALEACLELDPKRGGAWALLARLYGAREDKESLKKAAAAFESAAKLSPSNAKLVLNQGVIQSKLGDDKKALALFEKAAKMPGGEAPSARFLCQLYNLGGDNKKAEAACLKAALQEGASAETFYYLGFAQSRLGKKAEALKSFQRSVGINAAYAPALYSLGFASYEAGELGQALAHFQAAIKAKEGDYPEAQFNAAVVLGDLGRWPEAAEIYRGMLRKDPANADAKANLAYVVETGGEALLNQGKDSYEAGDFASAAKAWKLALELDPENATAKEFLGRVKKRTAQQDSAGAARKAAAKAVALRLKGEDEKVKKDGLAAFKAGNWSAAARLLDFYSRKHPKDAGVKASLYQAKSRLLSAKPAGGAPAKAASGEALKKQYFEGVDSYLEGNLPKAIGIWKKILAADPGHLDARRSLSQAEVELAALQKKK
jgi:tetratricopeptide (TPR) repeat protein